MNEVLTNEIRNQRNRIKILHNEIRNQRNRIKVLHELYEDEVSSLDQMITYLETEIAKDLEEVFEDIIPINIYGNDANQLWFEFDILGLDLDDNQIAMIEKKTKTIMSENMFYF